MKIRIFGESMDGKLRKIEDCITDNINRALAMYEEELEDEERIVYEFLED